MPEDNIYIGLLFGCPKGEADKDCPIKEPRELTPEDKYLYWTKLTDKEKKEIIQHHLVCTCKKPT